MNAVRISFSLEAELHRQLKANAALQGVKLCEYLQELCRRAVQAAKAK